MSEQGAVRLAAHAMGCRFELVLAGGPERWLRAAGEAAIEEIEEAHRLLTRFERGSVVCRINEGSAETLDEDVFSLFVLAEGVREAADGAFDVRAGAIGGIVIDSDRSAVEAIDGARVDLGGIAKGYAIDRAVRVLREAGVASAFVHGGSSSVASIGCAPDGLPWIVRVEHPADGDPTQIDVSDRSLAISGDQQQPGHLVDPRTGEPCAHGAMAVCVGESAAACDAWSTALAVLGARPVRMPAEYVSTVPDGRSWLTEPAGTELRSDELCQTSTADLS